MKKLLSILSLIWFFSVGGISQTSAEIPNVFTPDDDGVNDLFYIKTAGYDALTCTVFNRHGEVMYIFYGLHGSWDGFTHGGVKASAGTYFILLELTLPDGSTETKQGTLLMMY